jgi:predicted AlkP superfamily phosphohydrolase/phosphomutase
VTDPKTGQHPILKAFISKETYQGKNLEMAPDIVLGFNRGYRISWQSPLGGFPKEVVEDNDQKWSGDHMSAPDILPGIAFCSRKFTADAPAIHDLTASILGIFGVEKPKDMIGRNVLE